MNLAKEALQFLRTTQSGVLSTFSAKFPSYPFGSVAPFVLDHSGQPIILISTIAEHTQNITANPNVSLLVFAGDEDLQANARLTLIGQAIKIDKGDTLLRARYLRYLPNAVGYFDMHDFNFYRIEIAQIRYIAGFGKMGWIKGSSLSEDGTIEHKPTANSPLANQEASIIEHMNADHVHSLIAYCQHYHGAKTSHVKMLGIDVDGFDARAVLDDGATKILRFNFAQPIRDALSARVALIAMSKEAKI